MPDTPMEGENSPTDYTDWHPPHRLHRLAPGDSTDTPRAGREALLELVEESVKSVGRSSGSCDHEVTWRPAGYAGHPDWREKLTHRFHRLAPGGSTNAPPAGREALVELVEESVKSVGGSSGPCDHEVTWPPAGYAGHPDWRERTHPQITQIGTRPQITQIGARRFHGRSAGRPRDTPRARRGICEICGPQVGR